MWGMCGAKVRLEDVQTTRDEGLGNKGKCGNLESLVVMEVHG